MREYRKPVPVSTQRLINDMLDEMTAPHMETKPVEPCLHSVRVFRKVGITGIFQNGEHQLRVNIRFPRGTPVMTYNGYISLLWRCGEAEFTRRQW